MNGFAGSFEDNINDIPLDIGSAGNDDQTRNIEVTVIKVIASTKISEFEMVTKAEVEKMIRKSATNTAGAIPFRPACSLSTVYLLFSQF